MEIWLFFSTFYFYAIVYTLSMYVPNKYYNIHNKSHSDKI